MGNIIVPEKFNLNLELSNKIQNNNSTVNVVNITVDYNKFKGGTIPVLNAEKIIFNGEEVDDRTLYNNIINISNYIITIRVIVLSTDTENYDEVFNDVLNYNIVPTADRVRAQDYIIHPNYISREVHARYVNDNDPYTNDYYYVLNIPLTVPYSYRDDTLTISSYGCCFTYVMALA